MAYHKNLLWLFFSRTNLVRNFFHSNELPFYKIVYLLNKSHCSVRTVIKRRIPHSIKCFPDLQSLSNHWELFNRYDNCQKKALLVSCPIFANILLQYIFSDSIGPLQTENTYLVARLFHTREDQRHKRLMWDQQQQFLAKYLQYRYLLTIHECVFYRVRTKKWTPSLTNLPYFWLFSQAVFKIFDQWSQN